MQYNYQLWRHSRNEKATSETREQANTAGELLFSLYCGETDWLWSRVLPVG